MYAAFRVAYPFSVTDLLVCNMEEDTNNEIFDEVWDLYGEMKSQR